MTTRQDLIIRQGETWSFVWTKKDSAGAAVNLTGYTARMSLRTDYGAGQASYLSTGADADGGTIALGGALGTVTLSMTAAQTAALLDNFEVVLSMIETGEYYGLSSRGRINSSVEFIYDLELISGAGVVTRELEGRVCVYREVSS